MDWMNQIGGLLQNYAGGQQSTNIDNDYEEIATAAPNSLVSQGLAAAFRSNDTPPFANMLGNLFAQSNGNQRADLLNTLIGAVGPTVISQALGGNRGGNMGGLAGLASNFLGGGGGNMGGGLGNLVSGFLSSGARVTPEMAEQIPAEAVERVAAQAEQHDGSIIDTISDFYAQHPTLVKGLGAAALGIALSQMANRSQS